MNYLVIPEGLFVDTKNKLTFPSFIFKEVLNKANEMAKVGDIIYICPANSFGGNFSEQHIGAEYLKDKRCKVKIISFELNKKNYIDTFGNAYYLKSYLIDKNLWPLENCYLIVNKIHSYRSKIIFNKLNYSFTKIYEVNMKGKKGKIVKRLFYYNFPKIHAIYEFLCVVKFFIDFYLFKKLR